MSLSFRPISFKVSSIKARLPCIACPSPMKKIFFSFKNCRIFLFALLLFTFLLLTFPLLSSCLLSSYFALLLIYSPLIYSALHKKDCAGVFCSCAVEYEFTGVKDKPLKYTSFNVRWSLVSLTRSGDLLLFMLSGRWHLSSAVVTFLSCGGTVALLF